ncbi:MAG TPA: outer membrane beta-barrel protein [Kofleriaceae bacterium]|nr:outer membrane beta-barrel protein [Kofleriaceae bacterium]
MTRAALVVILIAAAAPAASADGYIGLGIGTSPSGQIGSDKSSMYTDGSRSWRGTLGYRFGHLSIEGTATAYDQIYRGDTQDADQFAGVLKYSLPLGRGFEAFGRGGLQRTDLSAGTSGNGWLVGGGFEFRWHILLTGASAFVEYTHADTTFDVPGTSRTLDGTVGMWTLGLTLSI